MTSLMNHFSHSMKSPVKDEDHEPVHCGSLCANSKEKQGTVYP